MPGDGGPTDILADTPVDAAPACLSDSQCTATAPVCDMTSHTCRGCTADADCATISGGACTEYNGQCVADADTIYVATTGTDGGTCTKGARCATLGYALTQVTATRLTIAVGNGAYAAPAGSQVAAINITVGRVVISGLRLDYTGGATFSTTTDGVTNPPVISINNNNDIVIEGVTIANGPSDGVRSSGALLLSHVHITGNNSRGVNASVANQAQTHIWGSRIDTNVAEGIFAQSGPLEILRSQIINNTGGGLSYHSGAITLTSTIISGNGGNGANLGGVLLQNLQGNVPNIQFVTIAFNTTKNTGGSPGLQSDVSVAIANSIAYSNAAQNVTTPLQICTSCTATYTLFSGTPPIGTGNIAGAPLFVNVVLDNFHIQAGSPARNAADPNASIHFDVDGEPRPQGPGYDMGADEIP
jgi:hypothetical protein